MNLEEQIRSRINELIAGSDPDQTDLRAMARRLEALPIFPDISGCLALRPDGSFIFCAWDTEECTKDIEPEFRIVGLVSGSEKYPELKALLPTRPGNAKECEECKGTGRFVFEGQVHEMIFCGRCSGLGWKG